MINSNDEQPVLLSVVIPAYLEAENLRLLLPRLRAVMDESVKETGAAWEAIVVDTVAAMDETRAVCQSNGMEYIARTPANTFGDAARTGIARARGDWIIWMDADGSHAPEFIPRLLEKRDQGDVIIASRYVAGGYSENSWSLMIMSRALNLSYSLILGLHCKDVSNSFKLYRGAYLRELRLTCHNFDVIEEILYKIKRRHPDARFVEVPFTFKKRMFGETKRNLLAFLGTYLLTMIRLRFTR